MELAELLERESLDPEELIDWAHARANALILELRQNSDELLQLLESDAQIDLDAISLPVPVRPEPEPLAYDDEDDEPDEADDEPEPIAEPEPEPVAEHGYDEHGYAEHAGVPEPAPAYDPTPAFDMPADFAAESDQPESELGDADEGDEFAEEPRGRRRVPSTPQPLTADELPPPPEHPRLADGEPEPILETVDTGPIDLGTPEAARLIAETSSRVPDEFDMTIDEGEPAQHVEAAAEAPAEADDEREAASDDSVEDEAEDEDEFELVEIDDEELELIDMGEDEDDAGGPPPPPPPPPPSGGPPKPPGTDADADADDGFDIDMD